MLVLGLGMMTACSDDDDNKSEEQKEQEKQEALNQANAFWDVVGQLTSIDNYTVDYQNKTFEPTIGEPLEGNNTVRVVATNDMASAAARFASLVGASIDASTLSFTYTNDAVGTLTYTKTDNGQSWATVDVNIKQLPKLQQIIYRSPEQGGTNASKMGTCYYRFGDVVKKTYKDKDDDNKEKTEYWVCVRPAFNPEGKGDSHWISLSPLPKKNIWEYTTKTNATFALPTGIGKNEEHMQNLAEMLFAIAHPYEWQQNVENNPAPGIFSSGLRMFHDFSHDDDMLVYHSTWFWKRVANAWEQPSQNDFDLKNIYQLIFGSDYAGRKSLSNMLEKGLNLLTKGYSWWTSTSNNLSLYQYTYKNGNGNESNMHQVTNKEVKKDYKTLAEPININNLDQPYIVNADFFGDNAPRYIIRHATGKELAGAQPTVYTTLSTNENGITDVYNYNTFYGQQASNLTSPEEIEVKKNYLIGKDGKFYRNLVTLQKANTEPVAYVLYVGPNADSSNDYNGLAISMRNSEKAFLWSRLKETTFQNDNEATKNHWEEAEQMNGVERTYQLGKDGDDYPAAKEVMNYQVEGFNPEQHGLFSNWFMPTAGQITKILEAWKVELSPGKGIFIYNLLDKNENLNLLKGYLLGAGFQINCAFWTITEYSADRAVNLSIGNLNENVIDYFRNFNKDDELRVRPFIAF